jgi:hypothetical protein
MIVFATFLPQMTLDEHTSRAQDDFSNKNPHVSYAAPCCTTGSIPARTDKSVAPPKHHAAVQVVRQGAHASAA